jgi:hypothetical protein
MNVELLKDIAIRITVVDNLGSKYLGSGVITRNRNNIYYIITAEHCIYGKRNKRLSNINLTNITVEYKKHISDPFKNIEITEIVYSNTEDDIAILTVNIEESNLQNVLYSEIINESDCKNLVFRGYPKWLSKTDSAKTFNCKIEENDNTSFFIKSDEIKDITFQKDIVETSSGLSGSGVYEIKNGKIFLLGIITDLRDSQGFFGHMKCSKLTHIFDFLDYEMHPLSSDAQQLYIQSEKADLKNIALKIASLKSANNDRFDNLYRKCEVLYDIQEVNTMVDEILTEFFTAEIELNNMGKLNGFIQTEFDQVQGMLSKRVNKTLRNQQVKNKEEAQEIYGDVMKLFYDFMKTSNNSLLSASNIDSLGDKAVNELLLNCDLNFVKHD